MDKSSTKSESKLWKDFKQLKAANTGSLAVSFLDSIKINPLDKDSEVSSEDVFRHPSGFKYLDNYLPLKGKDILKITDDYCLMVIHTEGGLCRAVICSPSENMIQSALLNMSFGNNEFQISRGTTAGDALYDYDANKNQFSVVEKKNRYGLDRIPQERERSIDLSECVYHCCEPRWHFLQSCAIG